MCGILAIIGKGKEEKLVLELSKRMSHRGPDESDLHVMVRQCISYQKQLRI